MTDRTHTRVLIAGGGVAALEATLALQSLAAARVAVDVVTPDVDFVYRPLAVAEPFLYGEVRRFPLERLVMAAGGKLKNGTVVSVDAHEHSIRTSDERLRYDVLLLALGARSITAVPGALTFRGPEDSELVSHLLDEALRGDVRRIAFAVPAGATRPLPLYELALETRIFLSDRGVGGVDVVIATAEPAPLALFGRSVSGAMEELLETWQVELMAGCAPIGVNGSRLELQSGLFVEAERFVAIAGLEGHRLAGVPCDEDGFVETDGNARVLGLDDVYAAGDMTSFPIKLGGIASEQADCAAEAIAARAGVPLEPSLFQPVVRAQLITGMFPRYLRSDSDASPMGTQPPWGPPQKIVGRYLTPFLAAQLGLGRSK